MTEYTAGLTPRDMNAVRDVAGSIRRDMAHGYTHGYDGIDIALGTIGALRAFVLQAVGPEGVEQELVNLAEVLRHGIPGENRK